MNWTKKPPTDKPGYYWWRLSIAFNAQVVRVSETGKVYSIGCDYWEDISSFDGEWYGPLQEPGGDAIESCGG